MNRQDTEIAVVGAGPVGLTAALCIASSGASVTIVEKNNVRPLQSRAIGITPPSLAIFERLGCVQQFIDGGVAVSRAGGYCGQRLLGRVDLTDLPTPYPFILAIPQHRTEQILESSVLANSSIMLKRGYEVQSMERHDDHFQISGLRDCKTPFSIRARYIIAADGSRSLIRRQAGIAWRGSDYQHTFLMADYDDPTGWKDEARLYFSKHGSVESFPLPGGLRRFVLRTPRFIEEYTSNFLEKQIPLRCGISVDSCNKNWESAFGVQRFLASSFASSRLFLCGDAAHVMSPIGGQNMNTGFADAECASWCINKLRTGNNNPELVARLFHRFRHTSAKNAAFRAEMMMRGGTGGGALWNPIRAVLMHVALRSFLRNPLFEIFTMLSIPNNNLASYSPRMERMLAS